MKTDTIVNFRNTYSINNVHYTKTPRGKITICAELRDGNDMLLVSAPLAFIEERLREIAAVQEK